MKEDLLRYWPREEDVAACIKTDAEAASDGVCLAIHQPMQFERRVIGSAPDTGGPCDEYELLRAFLAQKLTEGRVILPIEGSTGVGKSHVVRWLYAQMRRLPGADRRIVVRIPKGKSLKGVLAILLAILEGPAYEQYREQFLSAQERLDPREAAGQLCEALAYTLEEMSSRASERLRENPSDRNAAEIASYCNVRILPTLLRTQLLRDQHFVRTVDDQGGVAKRLVEQLSESRPPESEDDRQHVFTSDDLILDARVNRSVLGLHEQKALSVFDRPERREVATRILNEALDSAKSRLLGFGSTVLDIFDAVRRELLNEGKELVLLVEDFADLSGIQKELLQAAIKEAIRGGKQELCTMRTALAYTTGYPMPDTVLTRANIVYRIPDQPGAEDLMLARIERLVGAYLNAARIGETQLERAYQQSEVKRPSDNWIPRFSADIEPDARTTLDTFGSSEDKYEFFPFNGDAIHELAREGCLIAGRLVYNPRFVIQNILTKVLVHRDLFQLGEFPQASFGRKVVPARLVDLVRPRMAPSELDRCLRFLAYWGNSPTTIEDLAQIDHRLFESFGLHKPALQGAGPAPAVTAKTRLPVTESKTAAHVVDSLESNWEKILDEWRSGTRIPQREANQLRIWIAEGLEGAIDWDWDLFRPRKDGGVDSWFQRVFIPSAAGDQGRGAHEAMAVVCTEQELTDQKRSASIASASASCRSVSRRTQRKLGLRRSGFRYYQVLRFYRCYGARRSPLRSRSLFSRRDGSAAGTRSRIARRRSNSRNRRRRPGQRPHCPPERALFTDSRSGWSQPVIGGRQGRAGRLDNVFVSSGKVPKGRR